MVTKVRRAASVASVVNIQITALIVKRLAKVWDLSETCVSILNWKLGRVLGPYGHNAIGLIFKSFTNHCKQAIIPTQVLVFFQDSSR